MSSQKTRSRKEESPTDAISSREQVLARMTPKQRGLVESIAKLRARLGDKKFHVTKTIREIRDAEG